MEGCQVFIKEEMDDHKDTKDGDSSTATAEINEDIQFKVNRKQESYQVFIKEEAIEETKDGASSFQPMHDGDLLRR
jgi:hypothetical protein